MDYREKFIVEPGKKVRLARVDPSYSGKHVSHRRALRLIEADVARMDRLQYLLYADGRLWRAHQHAPARGEVVIFNRSHVLPAHEPRGAAGALQAATR